jgi:hypothetical protein
MKKITIATTPFGVALDLQGQALEAAKFIAKHQSVVMGDDVFNAIKSSVKMTVSSAFAVIYSKVVENGGWKSSFTLLNLRGLEDSIPTIFTLDDITVDGKYISAQMPKAFQTAWLNLTPILGTRGTESYNGFFQIKDTPRLAALISRGALCMSYNDSDQWLNSFDASILLDAFSFTMASPIRQLFNLDVEEEKFVRTIFAVYMAQMLQSVKDADQEVPPILHRCTWLGTPRDIMDRLAPIAEDRVKFAKAAGLGVHEVNLDVACKLIAKYGPDRMKNFSANNLVRFMSRSSMERNATIMSLYYPPYFVYMLLAAMHGLKHPIYSMLLKFGDMKRNLFKLEQDIVSSPNIIGVCR